MLELARRDVEPAQAAAVAWGDPPIVLRCGVDRPRRLQPTSLCTVVNDVGWYAESEGRPLDGTVPPQGPVVFTTVGRSPYIEVTVPTNPDRNPVDPLTDVAAAVQAATEERLPCA